MADIAAAFFINLIANFIYHRVEKTNFIATMAIEYR